MIGYLGLAAHAADLQRPGLLTCTAPQTPDHPGYATVPLLIFMQVLDGQRAHPRLLCLWLNLYFIYGVLTAYQPETMVYGALLGQLDRNCCSLSRRWARLRWEFHAQRVEGRRRKLNPATSP